MNDISIKKWFIKELCKNCLSPESINTLGFNESGYLNENEMMIVDAMFI
jgi:hypothetical protein